MAAYIPLCTLCFIIHYGKALCFCTCLNTIMNNFYYLDDFIEMSIFFFFLFQNFRMKMLLTMENQQLPYLIASKTYFFLLEND